MIKKTVLILALAATVAVPFLLRPRQARRGPTDDTLVIVTPNNEAICHEFGLGFEQWYRARTGRSVAIDWRMPGGTSEIARLLKGGYEASFQNLWTGRLGRPWSAAVQSGFQDGRLPADAPPIVREARAAFLNSDAGCGMDVFFGGGAYDLDQQAMAGRIVDSGIVKAHPDWFTSDVMPQSYGGEEYREPHDLWQGCVLSCYGMIYNRDALRRLGIAAEPAHWADLADPRLFGEVALCDPTKSGSIATAFENVIQEQMQMRLAALEGGRLRPQEQASARQAREQIEAQAVREGWAAGLRLLQLIGANARYFTDASQQPPIDVADGNCAVGMCIDFYGREQEEALRRRGVSGRLGFSVPAGGTAYSADPIALLRGAKNRPAAQAFIEYVLSEDGQKLWNFKTGVPGGAQEYALGRLPIRKDFYLQESWKPLRSDPGADPYAARGEFVYRPEWTGGIFREMAFIVRVMCQDTHSELAQAWRAIIAAPEPARSQALAALQDMSPVSYDRASGAIKDALESKDPVDEIRLARDLGDTFRRQYALAETTARGGD